MSAQSNGFVVAPEFSIGSVLSRTFSTLFHNPLLFFGLAAVASGISALLDGLVAESTIGTALSGLLGLFLGLVVQGMIAYAVFLALIGEDSSLGELLERGLTRFLPLLLVALFTGVCYFLGFLLLVVPGIILMCILVVTAQACVVEQLGAIDSMNRSAELTKGYRWHIFGLYVIVIIGLVVFAVLAGFIIGITLPGTYENYEAVVNFFINMLFVAFEAVMCGIIYFDLRSIKEGVTIDALADIFD